MKQSAKTPHRPVPYRGATGPSGPLQAKADKSRPVARLNAIAAQAASAPAQLKRLVFSEYVLGQGMQSGIKTSPGFDDNHLISGGVTPEISEGVAKDRKKKHSTVVAEGQLRKEAEAKRETLVAEAGTDTLVTLNFPSGTAYRSSASDAAESGFYTGESPEVKVMTRAAGENYVEIFHVHESAFDLNSKSDALFPALPTSPPKE